jgi:hypothetical protein
MQLTMYFVSYILIVITIEYDDIDVAFVGSLMLGISDFITFAMVIALTARELKNSNHVSAPIDLDESPDIRKTYLSNYTNSDEYF